MAQYLLETKSLGPFSRIFLLNLPANPNFQGSQAISFSRSLSQFSSLFYDFTVTPPPRVLTSSIVFITQFTYHLFLLDWVILMPSTVAGTEYICDNILWLNKQVYTLLKVMYGKNWPSTSIQHGFSSSWLISTFSRCQYFEVSSLIWAALVVTYLF